VHAVGPTAETIAEYHRLAAEHGGVAGEYRWGSRQVTITSARTCDDRNAPTTVFRTGEPMTIAMRYKAAERIATPVFGLAIYREDGVHLTGPNTRMSGYPIAAVQGRGEVRYRIPRLPLLPGRYVLSVSAYDQDLSLAYDHRERVATFSVLEGGTLERFGLMTLDGTWSLEPARDEATASAP
jgi:hypothetical protein